MNPKKQPTYQAERYRSTEIDEIEKKEARYGEVERNEARTNETKSTFRFQSTNRTDFAQSLIKPTSKSIREQYSRVPVRTPNKEDLPKQKRTDKEDHQGKQTHKKDAYGYVPRSGKYQRKGEGTSSKSGGVSSAENAGGSKKTLKMLKNTAANSIALADDGQDTNREVVAKSIRAYKRARRTIRTARTAAVTTKNAVTKTGQVFHVIARSIRKISFSKPFVVKSMATAAMVVLALSVLMGAITTVTTIIPSIMLKSDNKEMTRAYKWITALDAELTWDLYELLPEDDPNGDTVYKIYVNGYEATKRALNIRTNADLLLLYCDVKFGNYVFDGMLYSITTGTTTISAHLAEIHKSMYSFEQIVWYETVEIGIDEATGEAITKEIYRYDLCLSVKSFEELLLTDERYALTEEQRTQYEILKSVGIYTVKAELGSLFLGQKYFMTNRWGDYYDGNTTFVEEHNGIDLFMPRGTPINNALYGTVSDAAADSVTVSHGSRTIKYCGLESVDVSEGQLLERGTVIGTVGVVPKTGNAGLHIEYYIEDGYETNPAFFLTDISIAGSGTGDGNIVSVAAGQVGNGGETYWSWYGFNARVSWCACFVSWCANECGYIDAGIIPMFSYCPDGDRWFQSRGLWQPNGGAYIPKPGDIIFFDYEQNGESNHVGIVTSCDGSIVYTIEGNSSDQCRQREYSIYDMQIMGYGTPTYTTVDSGQKGE